MRAHPIALGGLLVALAVVILLLGGALGIGTYAAPILALAILLPLHEEYGSKVALLAWIAVSFLAFLLVPEVELSAIYAAFGWYPAAQPFFNRLPGKLLPQVAKLGIYTVETLLLYQGLLRFLGLTADLLESTRAFNILLFFTGAFIFLLADRMLSRFRIIWNVRFRERFFR